MSNLHLQFFYRDPDSARIETCTDIQDRVTRWTPEELKAARQFPVTFTCGTDEYALQFSDPDHPVDASGHIGYNLHKQVGGTYQRWPVAARGGATLPVMTVDSAALYIGDDYGARAAQFMFPSAASMLTYVKDVRQYEPGAQVCDPPINVDRKHGQYFEIEGGPRFLLDGEETSTLDLQSFSGAPHTPEQNVFSGLGFTINVRLLPAFENLYNGWEGVLSSVFSFAPLYLSYSEFEATGNIHVSADASPATFTQTDVGLRWRFQLDAQNIQHLHLMRTGVPYKDRKPLGFNVGIFAETDLLLGSTFSGENWAINGSAQPGNVRLSQQLLTPFQRWNVGAFAEWDVANHMTIGLALAGRLPTSWAGDRFSMNQSGLDVLLRLAFGGNIETVTTQKCKPDPAISVATPEQPRVVPPPARCGDGRVDAGEACDDGNTADGDGCSASCQIEAAPARCGDGRVDAGEACDDGNAIADDGCTQCRIDAPPPPAEPVDLPPKPDLNLSNAALFQEGSDTLNAAGLKAARESARKLSTYYYELIQAGFPRNTVIYLVVQGFTNTNDSEARNFDLSFRRAGKMAAAISKELGAIKGKTPIAVPRQLVVVKLGYGETQPIMVSGREDFAAGRRSIITASSSREIYDEALAESRRLNDARNNANGIAAVPDTVLADAALALLRNKNGELIKPFTKAFYTAATNTITLEVTAPYASSTEVWNRKVGGIINAAKQVIGRARTPLGKASPELDVALVVRPSVAAESQDISDQRENAINDKYVIFGQWPSNGGTPIYEIPTSTVSDAQLESHLSGLSAKAEQATKPLPGAVAATRTAKPITIGGVAAQHVTIPAEWMRFLKKGTITSETVALLQANAIAKLYKGKHVVIELVTPTNHPDPTRLARGAALALQEAGGARSVVAQKTAGPAVVAHIIISDAKLDPAAVHEVLIKK